MQSTWYMVYVCMHAQSLQLCWTLCDPIDYSPPGSSVLGILQTRILEWVAMSSSRGSSQSRGWTCLSCIMGGFFTHWATWEELIHSIYLIYSRNSANDKLTGFNKAHFFLLNCIWQSSPLHSSSIHTLLNKSYPLQQTKLLKTPNFLLDCLHLWDRRGKKKHVRSDFFECSDIENNWHFWTVVLEKTPESPLDSCKEIQPVHPKGNQSWIFIGRTDVEAETPILWPPDVKNWLNWKDPDAVKDWRWEEKGKTEDEMIGWHHQFNGHEFE